MVHGTDLQLLSGPFWVEGLPLGLPLGLPFLLAPFSLLLFCYFLVGVLELRSRGNPLREGRPRFGLQLQASIVLLVACCLLLVSSSSFFLGQRFLKRVLIKEKDLVYLLDFICRSAFRFRILLLVCPVHVYWRNAFFHSS